MSPKVLLEKNKDRKNRKSEEKETRRRKKNDGCTLSFYVDFFGDSFLKEKKKTCLRGEFCLAVTLFKNLALIYIFLTLAANRNLIKRISFKS